MGLNRASLCDHINLIKHNLDRPMPVELKLLNNNITRSCIHGFIMSRDSFKLITSLTVVYIYLVT